MENGWKLKVKASRWRNGKLEGHLVTRTIELPYVDSDTVTSLLNKSIEQLGRSILVYRDRRADTFRSTKVP